MSSRASGRAGALASLLAIASILHASAGCGGSTANGERLESPSSSAQHAAAGGKAAPSLVICAAKLELGSPQRAIRILDDGRVTGPDGAVGTLHDDGRFVATAAQVTTRIGRDGVVQRPDGATDAPQLRIDETGRATAGARSLQLLEDGSVEGAAGPGYRIVSSCKEGRRAAMFVMVVLGA